LPHWGLGIRHSAFVIRAFVHSTPDPTALLSQRRGLGAGARRAICAHGLVMSATGGMTILTHALRLDIDWVRVPQG